MWAKSWVDLSPKKTEKSPTGRGKGAPHAYPPGTTGAPRREEEEGKIGKRKPLRTRRG